MSGTADRLTALAAELAAASPPEGAGVVAAGMIGVAAGLSESIARASPPGWEDATGIAVQALTLRRRAAVAAASQADAYAAARDTLARRTDATGTGRDAALRAALVAALDALEALIILACDCAELAATVAAHCSADLRADAVAAADLAASAAGVAASLVAINLALTPADPRRARAHALAAQASSRARTAASTGPLG